jgi:hypothetical protein
VTTAMFLAAKNRCTDKQCAPAPCHDEATSPDFAIVPGLAPSDASKPPSSNAGSPFGLEEQIAGEQCPNSQKRSPTRS